MSTTTNPTAAALLPVCSPSAASPSFDVLKLLQQHPIFSRLGTRRLHAVASALTSQQPIAFAPNAVISVVSRDCFAYLIAQGSVSVYAGASMSALESSNARPTQILKPGDIIGFSHLLAHAPWRQRATPSHFGEMHEVVARAGAVDSDAPSAATATATSNETVLVYRMDPSNAEAYGPALQKFHEMTSAEEYVWNLDTGCFSSVGGDEDDSKRVVKIAFYDAKPYMQEYFQRVAADFQTKHPDIVFKFRWITIKLSSASAALAKGCEVVCIFVNDKIDRATAESLRAMNVRMVAIRAAGFNNVDLPTLDRLKLSCARVPAYSPYAVAEFAVALLMAVNRKTHHAYNRVRDFNFSLNRLVGFDLHGKTVGVLGTGKIGQCFIEIMVGFGCNVLCYDVYQNEAVKRMRNVRYASMDEVFAQSDVISLHLPLLPETHHLINKASIAKMKRNVVILNTGRGPLIDTRDLLEALRDERIGGAGLDVYEEEAAYFFEDRSEHVMKDAQLLQLIGQPNVILTSHQAFFTAEALIGIATCTLSNIVEYVGGKRLWQLTNSVNRKPTTGTVAAPGAGTAVAAVAAAVAPVTVTPKLVANKASGGVAQPFRNDDHQLVQANLPLKVALAGRL